jgi:catechol 2,3-dioxygenase-like lactoylglutathione lyase family enzyme
MTTFTYDHIHLRSTDPEKTAAYYARMFDAEIIRTMQDGATRIDMKIGGQNVFIAPVAPGAKVNPPPVTPYQGLDHFGLRVTGIDQVVADLKAKGAEFTMELNEPRPGIRICFVRGPEGVSIEVLERKAK